MASVSEPNVLPRLTPISGFKDAVAPATGVAVGSLAGANPDDVGVGLKHGYCPNRASTGGIVKDRLPSDTGVARPEHAARRGGYQNVTIVSREPLDGCDPSHHVSGTYVAPT